MSGARPYDDASIHATFNSTPKAISEWYRLLALGKVRRGGIYIAEIYHDDWCPLLAGMVGCACDPDVEFVEVKL